MGFVSLFVLSKSVWAFGIGTYLRWIWERFLKSDFHQKFSLVCFSIKKDCTEYSTGV